MERWFWKEAWCHRGSVTYSSMTSETSCSNPRNAGHTKRIFLVCFIGLLPTLRRLYLWDDRHSPKNYVGSCTVTEQLKDCSGLQLPLGLLSPEMAQFCWHLTPSGRNSWWWYPGCSFVPLARAWEGWFSCISMVNLCQGGVGGTWSPCQEANPRAISPCACPGLGGHQMVPKAGGVGGGSDAQSHQMCCQPHTLLPPPLSSQMCHPAEASLPAHMQEPQRALQRLPCSMEFMIQLGTRSFTRIRAEVTRACFGKSSI